MVHKYENIDFDRATSIIFIPTVRKVLVLTLKCIPTIYDVITNGKVLVLEGNQSAQPYRQDYDYNYSTMKK